jgi:AcrR family transcriptional regulator
MDTPSPTRKDLKREAILNVAAEVFAEDGFQAASMSEIAARVGGSKGTLYNYFDSKEALFEAHIRDTCGKIGAVLLDFSDDEPAVEVLRKFARRYLDKIFSDVALRTYQIIVGECHRTPQLAQIFFQAGPLTGRERLKAFLEAAVARGELDIEDCREAAWQFLGLCRIHQLEVTLGVSPKPTPEEVARQVEWAVEMFMMRYSAKRDI